MAQTATLTVLLSLSLSGDWVLKGKPVQSWQSESLQGAGRNEGNPVVEAYTVFDKVLGSRMGPLTNGQDGRSWHNRSRIHRVRQECTENEYASACFNLMSIAGGRNSDGKYQRLHEGKKIIQREFHTVY